VQHFFCLIETYFRIVLEAKTGTQQKIYSIKHMYKRISTAQRPLKTAAPVLILQSSFNKLDLFLLH